MSGILSGLPIYVFAAQTTVCLSALYYYYYHGPWFLLYPNFSKPIF
jgi:hypothetical protein